MFVSAVVFSYQDKTYHRQAFDVFYMHIFTPFNNFVAASMSIQIFHLDLVHIRKNKTNILLTL